MIEWFVLSVALIGTAVAAYSDLKTTEISDWVPLIIGSTGVFLYLLQGIITSDFTMFQNSITTGIFFLLIGYLLFYLGQWGEGDTLIFGSIGFIIPSALSLFPTNSFLLWYPLHFLANTFIIGFFYSLIYAIVMAFMTKGIIKNLKTDFKNRLKQYIILSVSYILFYLIISWYTHYKYIVPYDFIFGNTFLIFMLPIIFYPLLIFAKTIDRYAFRKEIPISKLAEGDVLAEDVDEVKLSSKYWVGLTKKDIDKIKLKRKSISIKEGVRFAPTFFLALLFTWIFGSFFTIVLSIL